MSDYIDDQDLLDGSHCSLLDVHVHDVEDTLHKSASSTKICEIPFKKPSHCIKGIPSSLTM